MHDFSRRLQIGVQDFEKLRKMGCLYVDKTEYLYKLVHSGTSYFISRPRRFGKSLFLSMLRYYFEGRKELFEGLRIVELEGEAAEAWEPRPVFYIDFNKKNFRAAQSLEEVLDEHLKEWEEVYGDEERDSPLEARFRHLVRKAAESSGKDVVVLVDEYDKPLLEVAGKEGVEHNGDVFKGFFSTLKSYDRYIRFVFITGVTKFGKVSIFSDLNQLDDISLDLEYGGICGISEKEIRENFLPEVEAMASSRRMGAENCLAELRRLYDGYHFHQEAVGVYNPFSLLSALSKKEFGMYWFSTGTPTFLIEKLKETGFDAKQITEGRLYADKSLLSDYRYDDPNPVPLFYQTGYLTISGYDEEFQSCRLNYPNDEVKYGFLESLAPMFLHAEESSGPLDIRSFVMDIRRGDTDSMRERFAALFASLPYPADEQVLEQNFQNVVYIVFMLLGQFVQAEVHGAKGRADCVVETKDFVYLFDFKRDKSAGEALRQIKERSYALPYAADKRKLLRIGVNFSPEERTIDGWEVERGLL